MRRFPALMLALALIPANFLRGPGPPPYRTPELAIIPLQLPSLAEQTRHLGAFELAGTWRMNSRTAGFGGYSALVALGDGRLAAFSDRGGMLRFAPPGAKRAPPEFRTLVWRDGRARFGADIEAAAHDAPSGRTWLAVEGLNELSRHDRDFQALAKLRPREMRDWGSNSGPEAMTRLTDGRFVLLREGFTGWFEDRRHRGLIYPADPLDGAKPRRFVFDGPARFSPTDMAQLPDGRVLILMRRLVWPLPIRFTCQIAIADPAAIRPGGVWRAREVARLSSTLGVDNFEGMAIEPATDGKVAVWLISDQNGAITQRTLLWKLTVDPAKLPG